MLSNKLNREFLLFLYALYYAQGSLYTSGSIISQACVAIFLLISGVYLIKSLFLEDKKSLFFIGWTSLTILNIVGFILTADFSNSTHLSMFKNIMGCMLSFYPFYYFAKKDELKATHLIRFLLIMLPIIILAYIKNKNVVLLEEDYLNDNNIVNNVSYMFVSLLPFVLLIKHKKVFSAALVALMLIFVIQGAKRGALIAGFVGLLMYFYYLLKSTETNKRIYSYLFAVIIILVLGVFAFRIFMSNEFMINRMTSMVQGDTSNRNIIYRTIFYNWYQDLNIGNFIFGYGFAGSLDITGGDYAHNDWLELLSNFGLIGIFVYIVLFYGAAKACLNKEWMSARRTIILTNTLIWFSITLVSMWYIDMRSCPQAILFGYLVGSKSNDLE